MEWKTIGSAPKEHIFILLSGGKPGDQSYEEEDGVPPMVVGWWDANREIWRFCSYDSGVYGEWEDPTHWAELPSQPASAGTTKAE